LTDIIQETAEKSDLKLVKEYLENIPHDVQFHHGKKGEQVGHGDSKSETGKMIVFQTKSMQESTEKKYVTKVMDMTDKVYVTYESPTWPNSAKTIIDEMIRAIDRG